ncbi:cell division GTPase [Thiohalobacter thiocyanaticus]|uniref:Cell division GTPase n=1 Tax=Thiohalobacter thiocyanaticus TaxID=585455 RepID=A0A1Z4VRI2_9GAMM|nr:hypothetical protein [Thiohalobacter thiocyanaticus]BAZ94022.1 cell division GTPase [Thiohalobacter thiocyanaticus]
MKYVVSLYLLLCSIPLHAGITEPDCTQLLSWAAQHDQKQQWQVTPRYQFPGISRDEVLMPLFGESVTRWSMEDFRNLSQWMRTCRQQFLQDGDPAAARTLATASGAMMRLTGYVQQFDRSRGEAEQAVAGLLAAPESQGRAAAIELAQQALRGTNIRRELRNVPREFMRPLMGLTNIHGLLPQRDIEALQAQLGSGGGVAGTSADRVPGRADVEAQKDAQSRAVASQSPDRRATPPPTTTEQPEPSAPAESRVVASQSLDVPDISQIELLPPPLQGGADVTQTRLVGVRLGMPLEAAIEAVQQAGFRLKDKGGSLHKLGVYQYWLDFAELEKGETVPFPGTMTPAESRAYQTRLGIQSVQSGKVSLVAYEGRVGRISVSASTFDGPDAVKAYVLERLGEPHTLEGYPDVRWYMVWHQDRDKQTIDDTQLRIEAKQTQYTDLVRNLNVPYTRISYSAWLCGTLPRCME